MDKPISTKLTRANIAKVLELLADTPVRLKHLSDNLSLEQINQPLGEGERSCQQDLAHLLNCEARSTEAIFLALLANEPLVVAIHPERQWGKLLRYELASFPELLAYFSFRRAALLRVLAGLTEKEWSQTIRESDKMRQESVYWLARSLALHEREHLADIESKLHQLGF